MPGEIPWSKDLAQAFYRSLESDTPHGPTPILDCSRCGYHGPPLGPGGRPFGQADKSGAPLTSFAVPCPKCANWCEARVPRERAQVSLIQAIRDADLSVDQLKRLGQALEANATAQEIGDAVPKARKVVAAAEQMSPAHWIALLTMIVTALIGSAGILVVHSDSEKARLSQEKAAKAQRTSNLTDEDLRKLAQRVAIELQAQNPGGQPGTP